MKAIIDDDTLLCMQQLFAVFCR